MYIWFRQVKPANYVLLLVNNYVFITSHMLKVFHLAKKVSNPCVFCNSSFCCLPASYGSGIFESMAQMVNNSFNIPRTWSTTNQLFIT